MRKIPDVRLWLGYGVLLACSTGMPLGAQNVTSEVNAAISDLWANSPDETCLPALDAYTQDRTNNAARALRILEKKTDKLRTLDLFEFASKRPDFWESVVTAGAGSVTAVSNFTGIPAGKVKSEAELFQVAEDRLRQLFQSDDGPKLLAAVSEKAKAQDFPRAMYLLLKATKGRPNGKEELLLFRTCYAKRPAELFDLVKTLLQ